MTASPAPRLRLLLLTAALGGAALAAPPAAAEDRLLQEAVGFAGAIAFLGSGAPGLLVAAVRDGETAFAGFGEIAKGTGKEPQPDTLMRIASVSKVFCGDVLGSLAVEGKVALTDPVQAHLPADYTVPEKDGHVLRLLDLVTQASGLPARSRTRRAERRTIPLPATRPRCRSRN